MSFVCRKPRLQGSPKLLGVLILKNLLRTGLFCIAFSVTAGEATAKASAVAVQGKATTAEEAVKEATAAEEAVPHRAHCSRFSD